MTFTSSVTFCPVCHSEEVDADADVCAACVDMVITDPERLLGLVDDIYLYLSGVGCCLHIVTDDQNIRDGDIDFCLKEAEKNEHSLCRLVARGLRALPPRDRWRVVDPDCVYHDPETGLRRSDDAIS